MVCVSASESCLPVGKAHAVSEKVNWDSSRCFLVNFVRSSNLQKGRVYSDAKRRISQERFIKLKD